MLAAAAQTGPGAGMGGGGLAHQDRRMIEDLLSTNRVRVKKIHTTSSTCEPTSDAVYRCSEAESCILGGVLWQIITFAPGGLGISWLARYDAWSTIRARSWRRTSARA